MHFKDQETEAQTRAKQMAQSDTHVAVRTQTQWIGYEVLSCIHYILLPLQRKN